MWKVFGLVYTVGHDPSRCVAVPLVSVADGVWWKFFALRPFLLGSGQLTKDELQPPSYPFTNEMDKFILIVQKLDSANVFKNIVRPVFKRFKKIGLIPRLESE